VLPGPAPPGFDRGLVGQRVGRRGEIGLS
jgi:hypothetical protein